jgi:transcriptional regulator with XRE-family HTH domain
MDRLAELRERHALTLRELSEMSGVAADTINQIELGHRKARPSTLRKLAKALDVEIREFFEEPALTGKAEALETGPSLLERALDAARRDEEKERKAINRGVASEGEGELPIASSHDEDKLRAELRRLGFPDEHFESFTWPLIVKATRGAALEQELATLREHERAHS